MTTYCIESFMSARPEMEKLLPLHWAELARDQSDPRFKLKPDWKAYHALEDAGQLVMMVARFKGAMVGYIIGFVRPQLHYRDSIAFSTDIYFILKDYRKVGIGVQLFVEMEKALRARGVDKFYIGCKSAEHLDHSKLFERLGFDRIEYSFAKVLA